jgi:hypothetical protein
MASDTSMVAMPKLLVDGFTTLTVSHTIAWAFQPTPPSPHDLMLQSFLPYWGHGCLCYWGAQRVFDCIDKGNGIFYREGLKVYATAGGTAVRTGAAAPTVDAERLCLMLLLSGWGGV